ncbi:MAG: hypothetical protein RBU29_11165, partial [bacterium]|nr:hypothetical protein [bacterium]
CGIAPAFHPLRGFPASLSIDALSALVWGWDEIITDSILCGSFLLSGCGIAPAFHPLRGFPASLSIDTLSALVWGWDEIITIPWGERCARAACSPSALDASLPVGIL